MLKRRFYLRKLLAFALKRLPVGSPSKAQVLTRAFEELEEVAHFRLRDFGFAPGGIVDIGAHLGDWTLAINDVFPGTPVLMIEAREAQRAALDSVCARLPNARHEIALLGSEPGKVLPFHLQDTGSSIFVQRSDVPYQVSLLETATLDDIVKRDFRLKKPLFLKLDVQGAELDVLRGGADTLSCAEVAQLEVALLHYNDGAPTAADVIGFMDEAGFAIFDVAEMTRTNGVDLAQIDLIFVRKTSPLRCDFFRYPNWPKNGSLVKE
jgi:FkbM family methyltransferase